MENSWKRIPLGKLISLQRGHDLPSQNRVDGQIPIMGSSGVTGWHNISKCAGPGVVIGRSGNSMGVVSYSEEDFWPLNTCLYVTDFKGNDERYIYYMLQQIDFDQFNSGSAQKSLNRNAIYPFEVNATTDTNEQKRIGKILANFENKISLNHQIIQTLDQLSQALFKSWFVDFDPVVDNALDAGFFEQDLEFSDELLFRAEARKAVREKGAFKPLPNVIRQLFPADFEECADPSFGHGGWVPKGWRVLPFGEFIERKSVGKKYDQKSASTEGKVPILDQGKSGIIGFHDDEPSVSASLDRPVIVFANHTCYMRLINFDFSAIQNVLPFTGRHVDTTWAFFATQGRVKFSEYKGHWPDFIIEKAVVPSLLLTTKFRDEIDSLLRITRSYELQNETLIKLRDTLLPKLISGELRLDEIEADLSKEEKPNSVGQCRDGWAATSPSSELHGCK